MQLTVADLVQRFDSGEIRLPLMQRDYVWKAKKVAKLLDSLYKNWPVGSFYVWQTEDDHPTKARVGRTIPRRLDGFTGFLLDGQQRLTSLSLAIQGEADGQLATRGFFDLENEQFYLGEMKKTIAKRIAAGDPLLVPLSEIIVLGKRDEAAVHAQVENVIQALREQKKLGKNESFSVTYRQRLHRLAGMLDRRALCEEFTDEHEEHAFDVFSRLNKGGTSLSQGDVEAARLASAATRKIVEPMRAMAAEKEMRVLGINFVFLLRTLVTIHRGNSSFSKLPAKWADDTGEVASSWAKTEKALRLAVDFTREQMGWRTRRWLPSTMALIPIAYMFAQTQQTKVGTKEAEWLKRYLLITGLRSLFRGSSETTVNSFVNAVRDSKGDAAARAKALFQRIPKNRMTKIRGEEIRATTGMYAPLMQIYFACLFATDARSWPSGRPLRDIVCEPITGDPVAVHHIFPKKFMSKMDVAVEQLNTMPNYAILAQADNVELSDRDPLDAWTSLKANQKEWAAAQLCFEASGNNFLKWGAYEEFVKFRSDKLAEKLNGFLGL